MSRLHGALSRATEGKAPILPPDAGVPATPGVEANQSAFTVPWTLDAQASNDAPVAPAGPAAAGDALLALQPARLEIGSSSEDHHKLVGSPTAETSATLAGSSPRRSITPRARAG